MSYKTIETKHKAKENKRCDILYSNKNMIAWWKGKCENPEQH